MTTHASIKLWEEFASFRGAKYSTPTQARYGVVRSDLDNGEARVLVLSDAERVITA
jgi:hypothetical protein